MNCRHCGRPVEVSFVDLGAAPPSNAYLTAERLSQPERWLPLRVLVCTACWLVQTEDFVAFEELFEPDYAYFSSISTSWRNHAESYVIAMASRFALDGSSMIVEVAANDGYLLEHALSRGIPSIGIEPTAATSAAARAKGIDIVEDFFGVQLATDLAAKGVAADLMVANNVLAHVPDINDFVAGFALLMKPNGVATFEFPHLSHLIRHNQFDSIYHEHFSYLSLTAVVGVLEDNGLRVFDVETLVSHGGSLRVFAERQDTGAHGISDSVLALLQQEQELGLKTVEYYKGFQPRAERAKDDFLVFLIEAKKAGKRVCAYGAAAKGNTFMNFAGIRSDLISFVVDRSPSKQNKFMPGSRIPIVSEDRIKAERPDYIVILPWNLYDEIGQQLSYVREWGAKLVTAIPELKIH